MNVKNFSLYFFSAIFFSTVFLMQACNKSCQDEKPGENIESLNEDAQQKLVSYKARLEAGWDKFKENAQQEWEKITEDEFGRIKGNFNELSKNIQHKYNKSKREADKWIREFIDKIDSKRQDN